LTRNDCGNIGDLSGILSDKLPGSVFCHALSAWLVVMVSKYRLIESEGKLLEITA